MIRICDPHCWHLSHAEHVAALEYIYQERVLVKCCYCDVTTDLDLEALYAELMAANERHKEQQTWDMHQ